MVELDVFMDLPRSISNAIEEHHYWKWISSYENHSIKPIQNSSHLNWLKKNTEQHKTREVMLVLEGKHFYGVDGKIYPAVPRTIFLFDENQPHDCRYSPVQPDCRDLWLHLSSKNFLSAKEVLVVNGQAKYLLYYPVFQTPIVEHLFETWNLLTKKPQDEILLALLKSSITTAIFTCLAHRSERIRHIKNPSLAAFITSEITEYIKNNLNGDLSVSFLASRAGYSRSHFHNVFESQTGLSLGDYIRNERLKSSKKLLLSGLKSETIADQLGFGTPSYFSRFFLRMEGITPSKWLIRSRNASSSS
jgi:AraC-like DNA-binding protein